MRTQLARKLRKHRMDTDKTLSEVAMLADVSLATIWRLEHGRRGNARTEYKVMRYLDRKGNGHDSLD
jgi:transcriptional regulator with XRE-family HTH domain